MIAAQAVTPAKGLSWPLFPLRMFVYNGPTKKDRRDQRCLLYGNLTI